MPKTLGSVPVSKKKFFQILFIFFYPPPTVQGVSISPLHGNTECHELKENNFANLVAILLF
jgi:hypothetical protein